MNRILGIDHIAITSSDLEAACRFYDGLFASENAGGLRSEGKSLVRQIVLGGALLSVHQAGNGIELVAQDGPRSALRIFASAGMAASRAPSRCSNEQGVEIIAGAGAAPHRRRSAEPVGVFSRSRCEPDRADGDRIGGAHRSRASTHIGDFDDELAADFAGLHGLERLAGALERIAGDRRHAHPAAIDEPCDRSQIRRHPQMIENQKMHREAAPLRLGAERSQCLRRR